MGSGRWGSGRLALMVGVAALVAGAVVLALNVVGDTPAPGVVEDVTPLGIRVDPRVAKAPGTELFGDVTVQPGSRLVGTTFPSGWLGSGEPRRATADEALLVLDGDPLEVWGRYTSELGMDEQLAARRSCVARAVTPSSQPPTSSDVTTPPGPPARVRLLTEDPLPGENELECTAEFRDGSLWLEAGGSRDSGLPVGHLWIQRITDSSVSYLEPGTFQLGVDEIVFERNGFEGMGDQRDPARDQVLGDAPLQPPDLPRNAVPRPLPQPGDRLDAGIDYYLDRTDLVMLPDGLSSAVTPSLSNRCNSGLMAVLVSNRKPKAAIDQILRNDDEDRQVTRAEFVDGEGRAVDGANLSEAGGFHLDLTALEAGPRRSLVYVVECGD